VVIRDRDIEGVSIPPHETQPPLVVDPNPVLTCPIAGETLEAVPGRAPQIPQFACVSKHS